MSGRYLLDTNIVIALFTSDSSVTQHLKKDVNIIIPSIVLGELYFGAQKSVHKERNISLIQEFAKECAVSFKRWSPSVRWRPPYFKLTAIVTRQSHLLPDNIHPH